MEEKVLKRGWVKNAAIIFLAVMLVLTFFSNTILNRSLPEIATQTIMSGPIESKVRGTGTVTSNENYEVIIKQSRKVKSVLAKVGQQVSTGDVLFVLESGDSEEIKAAEKTLKELQTSYKRALINASSSDSYAAENREIEKAQKELDKAQAKLGGGAVTDEQISNAEAAVKIAKDNVKTYQTEVDNAQWRLETVSGGGSSGTEVESYRIQMNARKDELQQAKDGLETVMLLHGSNYKALEALAKSNIIADAEDYNSMTQEQQQQLVSTKLNIYVAAAAEICRQNKDNSNADYPYSYYEAYENVSAATENVRNAQTAFDSAERLYITAINSDTSGIYSSYSYQLNQAKEKLDKANEGLTKAEDALEALKAKRDEVEACQKRLDDLIEALEDKRLADGKGQALEALELQEWRDKIAEQEELIASLSGEGGESEIKSAVNGIVQSISVSAGRVANADTALAVIEVPDLGYSLSFSVTNDQARLVHVGDTATVSNYYWGSKIDAELISIKTDSNNPQSSKILTFILTGDVSNGSSLTLAVGERSSNYDYVVPNSAIRSDSNGSFVLVINAKNSPLGTRYTAVRVDVEVIASDDKNSAVTGALNVNDYVLTTSNKPVANGDQVRLADTNS